MRSRIALVAAVVVAASPSLGSGPLYAQRAEPLSPGAHRVTLNGAGIAYHVAGEGPVVVAPPAVRAASGRGG